MLPGLSIKEKAKKKAVGLKGISHNRDIGPIDDFTRCPKEKAADS
jgi:hypothetical protein